MNKKLSNDSNAVVSLHKKREQLRGSDEAAFGARISRSDDRVAAANEQSMSLVNRIIIDESLPFYIAALDGTLIHANGRYEKLSDGLDNGSLTPGPISLMGRVISPSMEKLCGDVLASNTTVKVQENVSIGGRDLVLLGRHIPVRSDEGEIIAVAGTYEDVTVQHKGVKETARAQSRFQDFARASSDWFWECDGNMRIISISERFTAIVGAPASLYVGSRLEQFGKFMRNLEGRQDGQYAMDHKKPFRDQLFVYTGQDGEVIRFHLSAVPTFDREKGNFTGYRGVGMDVSQKYIDFEGAETTRHDLEDTLAELTRKNMALDVATVQAKSSLKAKNEFLASMSHELRTPLNAIIGFADTMKSSEDQLSDEHIGFTKDISDAGTHLLDLINDILDVAVIESGELTLNDEVLALELSLHQAMSLTLSKAEEKSINVDAVSTASDLYIKADHRRFLQILVNLLSNAFKFTPEGGEVGLDIEDNGTRIAITVWDTGIGIKKEDQRRVFEKFQQVMDNFYSKSQEGTGLGLHISRELARRMSGDITLESEEGQGSRFTVTVPLAQKDEIKDEEVDWI